MALSQEKFDRLDELRRTFRERTALLSDEVLIKMMAFTLLDNSGELGEAGDMVTAELEGAKKALSVLMQGSRLPEFTDESSDYDMLNGVNVEALMGVFVQRMHDNTVTTLGATGVIASREGIYG